MSLNAHLWARVAKLFDELALLSPAARLQRLDSEGTDPEEKKWVIRLLGAHDASDTDLLDSSINDIVSSMVDSEASAQPIPAEKLVGKCFGPWRALSILGRGGMGVVFKGERADGQFEKTVAIKLLPERSVSGTKSRRLKSEIRLLASLDHPGIARLLDGGLDDAGNPYLVMECVEGLSITRYSKEHQQTPAERMRLLVDVARAVSYSHQRLVVHCDIKPSNVLVTADGQVKLLDFGIAARLQESPTEIDAAPVRFIHLTPGYASPEQLIGQPPAMTQDIFALGALMFELLTDSRLRDARATTRVLAGLDLKSDTSSALLKDTFKDVDPDLMAICSRALASEPGERYSTTQELIADLGSWFQSYPVEARNGGFGYRLGKSMRRNYGVAIAATVAVLALLFGTSASIWQAREANRFALHAQAEAMRANTEQVSAERTLARSRHVSQFLQELFLASTPDRPRQQLPTTEEILARGAARALSARISEAGEQIDLLLAIANVYLDYQHLEQARPLVDKAFQLAEVAVSGQGDELARALLARGRLAELEGDSAVAEQWFLAGESSLLDSDNHWPTFMSLRTSRAWLRTSLAQYEEAFVMLKPLYAEVQAREDLSLQERFRFLNGLALLYKQREETDQALIMHETIDEFLHKSDAKDSVRIAVNKANLGLLHYNLGSYRSAEHATRQALDLFERISPEPSIFRSTVRRYLAYAQLQSGQFDEGEKNIRKAARELATVHGVSIEEVPVGLLELGWVHARFRRQPEQAEVLLEAALSHLSPQTSPASPEYIWTALLLARVHCQAGETAAGWVLLNELDELLQGKQPEAFQQQSERHETRAVCFYGDQHFDLAIQELQLALSRSLPPGRAVERADCHVQMASSLAALGRAAEAKSQLVAARNVFIELDMLDHPHLLALQAYSPEYGLD